MEAVFLEAMHTNGCCFHQFCKQCLEQYVVCHMASKPLPIFCPAVQCSSVVTVDELLGLLCNAEDVQKLKQVSSASKHQLLITAIMLISMLITMRLIMMWLGCKA